MVASNRQQNSEGTERILEHCTKHNFPAPSLIVYDGKVYTARWQFRDALEGKYLPLWKRIEEDIATKFFTLGGKGNAFLDFFFDTSYVKHHKNATAILAEPGFMNSTTEQEVKIIYSSGKAYTLMEIAALIFQGKKRTLEYRKLKAECGGYAFSHKPKRRNKVNSKNSAETCSPEGILSGVMSHVMKYHQPCRTEPHVYITETNPYKHKPTDRCVFYSSCHTSELEEYAGSMKTDRDYWMSACEYHIKLYETQRQAKRQDGDKIRTGTRSATTAREKWADFVQMNFLVIDFCKSEFDSLPTMEQGIELVLERCRKYNLPKPEIVNDGEKLEVKWIWRDVMKRKAAPSTNKYDDEFNPEFDEMQEKLFSLFCDLGADEKKLRVTTALRVPGTLNTRTKTIVRVAVVSEENISYKDMQRLLNCKSIEVSSSLKDRPANKFKVPAFISSQTRDDLSDCAEDVLSLHPGGEEYVFLCLEDKERGGGWNEWAVKASQLPFEIMKLKLRPDIDSYNVYISQSEFLCRAGCSRPERKRNNFSSCWALFVDLDWKLSGQRNLTAEEGRAIVLKHCEQNGIPLPSEIVHSGNGSHVKYFFTDGISRYDLKRWSELEKFCASCSVKSVQTSRRRILHEC